MNVRIPLTVVLSAALLAAAPRAHAAEPDTAQKTLYIYSVPYRVEKSAFEGKLVLPSPASAAQPLVVLFPDWMGVTPRATDDAKRIARMGYAVFVADPYGKALRPKNPQEAGRLAGALRADVVRMREIAAAALLAARRHHGVDSARVALVGYCFGGNMALELARSGAEVRGTASVHGNLRTPFPDDARRIRGRVLVLHGAADPHVPPAEVEAFKAEMAAVAGPRLTFVEYPGAMHAFTNPKANDPARGAVYDAAATKAAYEELERFFAQVLGATDSL